MLPESRQDTVNDKTSQLAIFFTAALAGPVNYCVNQKAPFNSGPLSLVEGDTDRNRFETKFAAGIKCQAACLLLRRAV